MGNHRCPIRPCAAVQASRDPAHAAHPAVHEPVLEPHQLDLPASAVDVRRVGPALGEPGLFADRPGSDAWGVLRHSSFDDAVDRGLLPVLRDPAAASQTGRLAAVEEGGGLRSVLCVSNRRTRAQRAACARGAHATAVWPLPRISRDGEGVMDETGAKTVATTVGALIHSVHEEMRKQVRGMDHGTINWKPLPLANSIAVLIVHTLGSEREMIRAVRRLASERDRDSEFKAEMDSEDLIGLLDQTEHELDEHLGALTAADLTEMRPRGDRPPKPGLEWLLSNYGHAREHLAPIELTKHLYAIRT